MGEDINWDSDASAYIRSRGARYPDGVGIEPEWTQEVMADVDLLALEPDPKSRMGAPGSSDAPDPQDGSSS